MTDQLILGRPARRVNAPALLMAALAIAAALPVLGPRLAAMAMEWPLPGIGPQLANSDFVNYWMAGRLAVGGDVSLLFDPQAYLDSLAVMFGEDYPPHNWSYPPHAILLFWPLGLLAYKPAMAAFLGLTLAFFLLCAEHFRRRFAPLADPAVFWAAQLAFVAVNLATTQNGFLTGGLILAFLAQGDRRPWLAGLCLGLLTIKPQLGLLAPFLLLFSRQWAAIGWAVFFTLALAGLSVLASGFESWRGFVEVVVPYQHDVMTAWTGGMLVMMPTLSTALRLVGLDAGTALSLQTAFSLACAPPALYALWKYRGDGLARAVVFATASFLVAPYSFNYDMGALAAVCAAFLASPGAWSESRRLLASILCLLPVAMMFLAIAQAPLSPLVLLVALLAWLRASPGDPQPAGRSR